MSDSRAAARCYFSLNSQKALPLKRRGFFVLALKSKNQERGTKNQEQPRSGSLPTCGDGNDLELIIIL
jgi:hypothetical protein